MPDAASDPIVFHPIGRVRHDVPRVPRHWSVSEVEGDLVIDPAYAAGLCDIQPGQRIVVLFHFDRSPAFTPALLTQRPPHRERALGVFSICSPRRPNAVGLSVLDVLAVEGTVIRARGLDMLDGTPIIDLKPWITGDHDCPSTDQK